MRTRIYVNGKPTWSSNEPARARPVGHGGAAMGSFSAPTVVVPRKPRGTATPEARAAKRRSV